MLSNGQEKLGISSKNCVWLWDSSIRYVGIVYCFVGIVDCLFSS